MPVNRYESVPSPISLLGQPLKFEFSGRVAKNRFYKASMIECLATWSPTNLEERGIPTKELIELYRRWGENEWGIIGTGSIDIEFDMVGYVGDGIITPECPLSGPRFEAFKEVAAAAKANGSLILGQINHPGRQLFAKMRKDTISASAIQMPPKTGAYAVPREATKDDIARIIDGFSYAAEYLQKAGFDGIEIHGAHGYLVAQFLSELSNQRTDKYGGSLENRMRLVVEIAEEIRRRTEPGFILGIKLNSVEFQEKGIKPAEAKVMCEKLQELGFDFVELSGGNHEEIGYGSTKESTLKREAYFLEFVRDIVPHLSKTKKYLTGGFRTVGAMVKALEILDGVGLGRPATQEPRLPNDILAGKVTGAIRPRDEILDDLPNYLAAAGAQIKQIADGREPVNLSNPTAVESLLKELVNHFAKVAADGDKMEYRGFPDLKSPETNARPYGEAY
ncbi:NADH:flavin oxidoreductase/NADH oxidase-like protein [Annulohypoxylon truncatum]|uniref:NADH:flavin oxidoreductase/NADH oxidase-like protein n=1 Tax=Annulohypoxylon truncatum TaxID=327061 RepID=UPI002007AE4D|nr:NADH:flavin oxidoreductase/NADH oxidase-like protein [Annulohypoxylon truncatum]KAI1207380.1 NADH:flavin oxidoreductase/NADH oxidase-like protein [Annulohypoxylon truncatum]